MIKTKTQTITKTEEVIEDIICNKCGKTCLKTWDDESTKDFYGVKISYTAGYLSDYLVDNDSYEFHLCEECLAKLIDSLKIESDRKSCWPDW